MRTFLAYFVLHPEHPDPEAAKPMFERAGEFMPEGITVEEAMKLGRIEFFTKLTEIFAVQYGVGNYAPRTFHLGSPPE
jgi:hypothetical protein